jgi:hypothetical protein
MKTLLLLTIMLITTAALVQGTPSVAGTKNFPAPLNPVEKKYDENKSQPNSVLVININDLREKTKDVSLLRPVFMIVSAVESIAEKIHGRKLKITCNK